VINNNINHLENYQYDYFCGVIDYCFHDHEMPVTYAHNDQSGRIKPLLDYILEISHFSNCHVQPTKAKKLGYAHAIAIHDQDESVLFTISYGGKQQNGTICVEVKGLHAEQVTPILIRHFQFRVTRIDVAINYDGDPSHMGKNETGHTYGFGSRASTTYIRHYQYGMHHFPKSPEQHNVNRIELEYKPQDKLHKVQAQHLTKAQLFLRSNNGRKIHEYLYSKLAKIRLVSDNRTPETDTIERIKSMAIRNRNIFINGLIATAGDSQQLMALILDAISEHEERQKTA
jgi:hypothetical protein